jgi:hypothetical protein
MQRDDLIEFLRTNLTITIDGVERSAQLGDGRWYEITATLSIGDEVISTDSFTLDTVA